MRRRTVYQPVKHVFIGLEISFNCQSSKTKQIFHNRCPFKSSHSQWKLGVCLPAKLPKRSSIIIIVPQTFILLIVIHNWSIEWILQTRKVIRFIATVESLVSYSNLHISWCLLCLTPCPTAANDNPLQLLQAPLYPPKEPFSPHLWMTKTVFPHSPYPPGIKAQVKTPREVGEVSAWIRGSLTVRRLLVSVSGAQELFSSSVLLSSCFILLASQV